jgi:uncharacterized protein (DUF488 family)
VLTIGHSNRSIQEFLDILQAHQVQLVIDVRKLPGSRSNPQFNQDTLPQVLEKYGIGYVHMPTLGGLRLRRLDSPNAGWKNASFQGYADYMLTPEFEEALQELLEQARDNRAALMCAEAVPWRCHRSLIADALVVRGIAVEHLFSVSRSQPHVLRTWAHVEGTRITYPSQAKEIDRQVHGEPARG